MVRFTNCIARIGAVSVLLGLFASGAVAEQGRFSLPFDAQWGSVRLPAGEYTLSTSVSLSEPRIITISGEDRTYYILATNEDLNDESAHNFLTVVNVSGRQFVREFYCGNTGKTFRFAVPKAAKVQLAKTADPSTKIAVLTRH